MDEYEFIVENGEKDQRMNFLPGTLHQVEQMLHLIRDELRRRCHEDTAIPIENTFMMIAKYAGFLHRQVGHHTMQVLQIIEGIGVEVSPLFIGLIGILNFLNLFLRTMTVFR